MRKSGRAEIWTEKGDFIGQAFADYVIYKVGRTSGGWSGTLSRISDSDAISRAHKEGLPVVVKVEAIGDARITLSDVPFPDGTVGFKGFGAPPGFQNRQEVSS